MRQTGERDGFRPEPAAVPSTTRIRTGLSARAVALAAVVVLAGVAWIGISNRPTRPDPLARPSFPIAQATPRPTARPTARPASTPSPTAIAFPGYGEPGAPIALLGFDAVAAIAQIEGRTYMGLLREADTDHFLAAFRVPFLEWSGPASLEVAQLWTRDEQLANYISLGTWPIDLTAMQPELARTTSILRETVAARSPQVPLPRAYRRGYSISVDVASAGTFGVLLVDVHLGNDGRHVIRGDDSPWLLREGLQPDARHGRIELQLHSYQLVVDQAQLETDGAGLSTRLVVPPATWSAPAWLQLRWVDAAGEPGQQLATVALSLGSPASVGLPVELAHGMALLPLPVGQTRHWDYVIKLERASRFSSPVEWVAVATLVRGEPTVADRAGPSVPLILLTAQPWHTQRSTRTHGESWVGGY